MITHKNKKRSRKQKDGKESILIILSTKEMYPKCKSQIKTLKRYIDHLSKSYKVDIAGISSKDDFDNYSDIINFRYKYINSKMQISKICDLISKYGHKLNYDWFVRTRPEIELLDFDEINFHKLPKDAVSGRARVYRGPHTRKHSCSVGGVGDHSEYVNCKYRNKEEEVTIDSNFYVFHKNVVDKGGFSKISGAQGVEDGHPGRDREDEWYLSSIMLSRGIKLNIIGINMKMMRPDKSEIMYSGNTIENEDRTFWQNTVLGFQNTMLGLKKRVLRLIS